MKIQSTVLFFFLFVGIMSGSETLRMQLLMDDIHPIYLKLQKVGDQLNGKYIYLSSGTEFQLEGQVESGRWVLREIDPQGKQSGWIVGRWKGQCLEGTWFNRDRSQRRHITGCDDRVLHAGDNKRYRLYAGQQEGHDLHLGIYRLAGGQFVLKWWSSEQQIWATYRGFCESVLCEDSMIVHRLDPLKQTAPDSIYFETKSDGLSIALWNEDERGALISCDQILEFPLEVESYADYFGTFDVVYPRDLPGSLQDQLNEATTSWKEDLIRRCDSLRSRMDGYAVSRRMGYASYGWLDIDWWNSRIISGRLYLIRTYGVTKVLPFLYDMEKEELIDASDLLRLNSEDIQQQLNRWWRQSIEPYCTMEGERYCTWLRSSKELYLGLQPTGLTLSNTFHDFYGKHTSTFRFDQFEKVLRGNDRWSQRLRE